MAKKKTAKQTKKTATKPSKSVAVKKPTSLIVEKMGNFTVEKHSGATYLVNTRSGQVSPIDEAADTMRMPIAVKRKLKKWLTDQ